MATCLASVFVCSTASARTPEKPAKSATNPGRSHVPFTEPRSTDAAFTCPLSQLMQRRVLSIGVSFGQSCGVVYLVVLHSRNLFLSRAAAEGRIQALVVNIMGEVVKAKLCNCYYSPGCNRCRHHPVRTIAGYSISLWIEHCQPRFF